MPYAPDHRKNFIKKICIVDGCWRFIGAKDRKGYGLAWYEGKLWRANRLSYFLHNGKITSGLHAMHICDHPWCVHPLHLKEGTAEENNQQIIKRGRHVARSRGRNAQYISWDKYKKRWRAYKLNSSKRTHVGWFHNKENAKEALNAYFPH